VTVWSIYGDRQVDSAGKGEIFLVTGV